MRTFYKILSVLGIMKAASKGPEALTKNYVRRKSHKALAKALRKGGI